MPDSVDSAADAHWLAHAGPRMALVWHDLPQEAKRRWQGSLWARRALYDCRAAGSRYPVDCRERGKGGEEV